MIDKIKKPLRNIFLCTQNPRVTNIDIDVNGNYFRKRQKFDDESQKKSAIEILSFEGTFSNFHDLLVSLIDDGYNEKLQHPFVIDSGDHNNFISIEGNRRILAMKLLNGLIALPAFDEIGDSADDEENVEVIEYTKIEKSREKNFQKIEELLKGYKGQSNYNLELLLNVIDGSNICEEAEEIQIAIFSNHVTGKVKGKRNWNRGRTLSLYLSFLKDKTIDDGETIKKISHLLNRTPNDVVSNLRSAQFVKSLISHANENYLDYFKEYSVSALERSYVKRFIDANGDDNFNLMIKVVNNNILDGQRTAKEFCEYIIQEHKNGNLTTRSEVSKIKELPSYKKFLNKLNGKEEVLATGKILRNTSFSDLRELSESEISSLSEFNKRFVKSIKEMKQITFPSEDKLFIDRFQDPKFDALKEAVRKIYCQAKLLKKEMDQKDSYDGIFFNGILVSSRTLSELILVFLITSPKFKNILCESLKNRKASYNKKSNSIREINRCLSLLDKGSIEELLLKAVFENTTMLFGAIKKAYNDGKLSFEQLNNSLNEIETITPLSKTTWDWIFSDEKYNTESKAIHAPHFFEIELENEELRSKKALFVKNNFSTFEKIVVRVILNKTP